eukprot:COSAG01_NODE_28712_length_654_cov_3.706306_1_plen_52_part_10
METPRQAANRVHAFPWRDLGPSCAWGVGGATALTCPNQLGVQLLQLLAPLSH